MYNDDFSYALDLDEQLGKALALVLEKEGEEAKHCRERLFLVMKAYMCFLDNEMLVVISKAHKQLLSGVSLGLGQSDWVARIQKTF